MSCTVVTAADLINSDVILLLWGIVFMVVVGWMDWLLSHSHYRPLGWWQQRKARHLPHSTPTPTPWPRTWQSRDNEEKGFLNNYNVVYTNYYYQCLSMKKREGEQEEGSTMYVIMLSFNAAARGVNSVYYYYFVVWCGNKLCWWRRRIMMQTEMSYNCMLFVFPPCQNHVIDQLLVTNTK